MIWYVSHKTLSQQQQEAIRWYNNWPPAPPKKTRSPTPILHKLFSFHIADPATLPSMWPLSPNRNNQTNKLWYNVFHDEEQISLSLSVYPSLSILSRLSIWIELNCLSVSLSPLPTRTEPYPMIPIFLKPFLLLCCAPFAPPLRSAPSLPHSTVWFPNAWNPIHFYYKKNLLQLLLLLQITIVLGHGCWESWWRWPTTAHTAPSRYLPLPAGRYPSNWSSPNLLTTTITLLLFSLTAFQYFGIFSDRKNIPAPVEASPPSPRFSLGLSRDGASEAGRIGINGH